MLMKKISLKLRVTLWYTLTMIILSSLALAAMSTVGREMLRREIVSRLITDVNDVSRRMSKPDIQKPPEGQQPPNAQPQQGEQPQNTQPPSEQAQDNSGESSADSDSEEEYFKKMLNQRFTERYRQSMSLAVFDLEGELIYGELPFENSAAPSFDDNQFHTITSDGVEYCVFDRKTKTFDGSYVWLRGVSSVDAEGYMISSVLKTNAILAIILIIIAAVGGYFIIMRALVTVNKISHTAQEISESNDLSQRINIGSGKDEICRLANTFDAMLDKIEQSFEGEKQFTSDASHELRTPVAVILSECEFMEQCADTADDYRESANSIKRQAEKMSKLISELLSISRMDKKTQKLNFEDIDLSELINFVCDEQAEIHGDEIKLIRNIPPSITVNADRFLIARLFINLISNAYKYSGSGKNITVSLTRADNSIRFSVKDEGIGIAEDDLKKIWDRFYQVDPARSNSDGSMGLGLAMVKQIAQCHNGKVWAESKPNSGSTFIFTMPCE